MTLRQHRGFTLVEVLVAMVIMAIMAVMAWQGVDGIVRARDASQVRLERTLRVNAVIAQWDRDLAEVQETGVISPALKCAGGSVQMTRRTPTGIQLVIWTLRRSGDNTPSIWERWAGPSVTTQRELSDSFIRSQQLQGGEPGSIKALPGLSDWKIYFYSGSAWANCGSSLGTGSGGAPTLPDGVRIVLSFAPGSGLSGDLTRDTPLSAKR